MTNMTYVQAIDYVLEVLGSDEVVAHGAENHAEVIDKMKALKTRLAKRSTSKTPTKTQVENEGFKATIIEYLTEVDSPKSIKELQSEITDISGLTNQRITHMLTDLVKSKILTKEYVKKTPYYSIAA